MSQTSYLIGIGAALAAGMAFNLGILMQKKAVDNAASGNGLMKQLVRTPLWLSGFALQFLVGMPLNVVAQGKIGPFLIPGLMAAGLIVLAAGSIRWAGESLDLKDIGGLAFVILSAILFGSSRLAIHPLDMDIRETGFPIRLGAFALMLVIGSLACHIRQKNFSRTRGVLRILNAGLLLAQSNLWLGVLMALLWKWGGSDRLLEILALLAASLMVFAGSMLGIAETQRAFQWGGAAKLVPIQYVPVQVVPIVSYFAVFRGSPQSPAAVFLALGGVAMVILGAALLARRQIS